jgi:hypothetical protein
MLNSQLINEKRRLWGFSLLLCLTGFMFWAVPAPALGATELKAKLVKETMEGTTVEFMTGQVQLTYPDGRTKLLKYRSCRELLVVDGKVYIFTTKDGEVTGIVVYDSAKGRGQSFPLPEDLKLDPYFCRPSFSPDATKVAYYFLARPGEGGARVRFWPDWRLLWESPVYGLLGTDVPPVPPIWKTKSLVEFDPHCFDPPQVLKYQAPEPGGKDAQ